MPPLKFGQLLVRRVLHSGCKVGKRAVVREARMYMHDAEVDSFTFAVHSLGMQRQQGCCSIGLSTPPQPRNWRAMMQ